MAKPTVTLIPWDPNSPEHVRRMVEQRIACGWQASLVPTVWKDGHINGTKCVYWIIFPQDEPQREKYLNMHIEAYPKVVPETEELLDSSETLLGKPRVPTDAKFLPVGHVALDTHISDYGERVDLNIPKSGAYWVKSLYVSYTLQGLGIGGAAMNIAERMAIEEPLNARHLLLDTMHHEDQADEEFAVANYGGAFKTLFIVVDGNCCAYEQDNGPLPLHAAKTLVFLMDDPSGQRSLLKWISLTALSFRFGTLQDLP
ncbi:hypothetical protein FBULB1_6891 [Fusarium bulbicola]|nr:hypothetical protein FBULB1_6891 [Fusarium bulbicola]